MELIGVCGRVLESALNAKRGIWLNPLKQNSNYGKTSPIITVAAFVYMILIAPCITIQRIHGNHAIVHYRKNNEMANISLAT